MPNQPYCRRDSLFLYPETEIEQALTIGLPLGINFPAISDPPEVHQFEVDVRQLFLVIRRTFSSPEVFLRELISNASDALGRFKMVQGLGCHPELSITIEIDKDDNTLSITDNGIGMTKEDLVLNLGTIGRSGTKEYVELLKSKHLFDPSMIGQFGFCFFSVFLVADSVKVTTKHNKDKQYKWESHGDGTFTVVSDEDGKEHEDGKELERGTRVTLSLKKDQMEYLEERKIKHLVKKYSEFVMYPIYLKKKLGRPYSDEIFAEVKKGALKLRDQQEQVASKGYSKTEISHLDEQMQRARDLQLKRITEMVESKMRETTMMLEQKLANEHAARLKAEETALEAQQRSEDQIRKLRHDLQKAEELRKRGETKCAIL